MRNLSRCQLENDEPQASNQKRRPHEDDDFRDWKEDAHEGRNFVFPLLAAKLTYSETALLNCYYFCSPFPSATHLDLTFFPSEKPRGVSHPTARLWGGRGLRTPGQEYRRCREGKPAPGKAARPPAAAEADDGGSPRRGGGKRAGTRWRRLGGCSVTREAIRPRGAKPRPPEARSPALGPAPAAAPPVAGRGRSLLAPGGRAPPLPVRETSGNSRAEVTPRADGVSCLRLR